MKPFIHLFKTWNNYYFYDVNRNKTVLVSEKEYQYLQDIMSGKEPIPDKKVQDHIDYLKSQGFLKPSYIKKIVHPDNDELEYHLKSRICMMTLQVTQNCNLRCSYCPYSGGYEQRSHNNQRMSFDIAKKSMDFFIAHSEDQPEINLGFYGGEPFLEVDLIENCIEYMYAHAKNKVIKFSVTTNGTLFNERIIRLLKKYPFNVLISLDGPKEIHDKNRVFANGKGSYDVLMKNLTQIRLSEPDLYNQFSYNMVMDPTVEYACVQDFVKECHDLDTNKFSFSDISTQYQKDPSFFAKKEDYIVSRNYEYFKCLLFQLGRIKENSSSAISNFRFASAISRYNYMNILSSSLPEKAHPGGPCIPGSLRLFVDVNGYFYPCEKVSETSKTVRIGHVDTGFNISQIRKILSVCSGNESCKTCWAFRNCGICICQADDGQDISLSLIQKSCRNRRMKTEQELKDICMLKEYGYQL